MRKEKLLYIMGIDWTWIYQRPQIIAELLAQDYDITVLFPRSIFKRAVRTDIPPSIQVRVLWTLPYQEKNGILQKFSSLMNRAIFKDIHQFDLIYINYPLYARYIPASYHGRIVYDCIDNYKALYPDPKRVDRILREEQELVKQCNLLFATSEQLKKKMDNIAGYPKAILLRNGFDGIKITPPAKVPHKIIYRMCYIGTISDWFDYELLFDSADKFANIEYHLIGPAILRQKHFAFHYHGVVPHQQLADFVEQYDCMVMPFVVDDVVMYVDPVKLYEYISFGKCIISVYYPELEYFREFVYFYSSPDEYVTLVRQLEGDGFPAKYSKEQQERFLEKNTWKERYRMLHKKLSNEEQSDEI